MQGGTVRIERGVLSNLDSGTGGQYQLGSFRLEDSTYYNIDGLVALSLGQRMVVQFFRATSQSVIAGLSFIDGRTDLNFNAGGHVTGISVNPRNDISNCGIESNDVGISSYLIQGDYTIYTFLDRWIFDNQTGGDLDPFSMAIRSAFQVYLINPTFLNGRGVKLTPAANANQQHQFQAIILGIRYRYRPQISSGSLNIEGAKVRVTRAPVSSLIQFQTQFETGRVVGTGANLGDTGKFISDYQRAPRDIGITQADGLFEYNMLVPTRVDLAYSQVPNSGVAQLELTAELSRSIRHYAYNEVSGVYDFETQTASPFENIIPDNNITNPDKAEVLAYTEVDNWSEVYDYIKAHRSDFPNPQVEIPLPTVNGTELDFGGYNIRFTRRTQQASPIQVNIGGNILTIHTGPTFTNGPKFTSGTTTGVFQTFATDPPVQVTASRKDSTGVDIIVNTNVPNTRAVVSITPSGGSAGLTLHTFSPTEPLRFKARESDVVSITAKAEAFRYQKHTIVPATQTVYNLSLEREIHVDPTITVPFTSQPTGNDYDRRLNFVYNSVGKSNLVWGVWNLRSKIEESKRLVDALFTTFPALTFIHNYNDPNGDLGGRPYSFENDRIEINEDHLEYTRFTGMQTSDLSICGLPTFQKDEVMAYVAPTSNGGRVEFDNVANSFNIPQNTLEAVIENVLGDEDIIGAIGNTPLLTKISTGVERVQNTTDLLYSPDKIVRNTFREINLSPLNTNPTGMTFGGNRLFVVDGNTDSTFIYDIPSKAFVGQFPLNSQNNVPAGATFGDDVIWIVDTSRRTIYGHTADGTIIPEIALPLHSTNTNATGIGYANGKLYVCDLVLKKIFVYGALRQTTSSYLPDEDFTLLTGGLTEIFPEGVTYNNNRLFVTSSFASQDDRIHSFSLDGVRDVTLDITLPAEILNARGISYGDGNIWILGLSTKKIFAFDTPQFLPGIQTLLERLTKARADGLDTLDEAVTSIDTIEDLVTEIKATLESGGQLTQDQLNRISNLPSSTISALHFLRVNETGPTLTAVRAIQEKTDKLPTDTGQAFADFATDLEEVKVRTDKLPLNTATEITSIQTKTNNIPDNLGGQLSTISGKTNRMIFDATNRLRSNIASDEVNIGSVKGTPVTTINDFKANITEIVTAIENGLLDDTDGRAFINAIVTRIQESDLTAEAITSAIWNRPSSELSVAGSIGKLLTDRIDAMLSTLVPTSDISAIKTNAELLVNLLDGNYTTTQTEMIIRDSSNNIISRYNLSINDTGTSTRTKV